MRMVRSALSKHLYTLWLNRRLEADEDDSDLDGVHLTSDDFDTRELPWDELNREVSTPSSESTSELDFEPGPVYESELESDPKELEDENVDKDQEEGELDGQDMSQQGSVSQETGSESDGEDSNDE
ncbi:hypothetical protein B0T14DRAFT_567927 [Immersiella caudata]|uniref:Uncharacterized protein n=1 Tax=Immersiella caudata TaxID=314043 RepID=A0AA39WJ47_9PEZI|nr:hypothetical protein B0T14DRAFT_567927 [Immersiella caudata]